MKEAQKLIYRDQLHKSMDLWVPSTVDPSRVESQLQHWLDESHSFAYRNIIQDRINSTYPRFGDHKTLYIVFVSDERRVTLVSTENPKPVETCPICYETDSVVRQTLPCGHTFHLHCVEQWLRKNNTCPMCRCKINV